MHNKPKNHKLYGLLKQLLIPLQPWESILMDFIEQLPPLEGYTDILVVVDRLTKQAIFTPTVRTIDARGLAELFIRNVFAKHRIPAHVTSDRGSEFVSRFFRSLAMALNMRLHFTSGYHPKANGQTERTNQTLEHYLRTYCNYQQSDWARLLPLVEFTYNNTPSAMTGMSSFYANKDYHSRLQILTYPGLPSQPATPFVADLEEVYTELKLAIREVQERYQKSADAHRTPVPEIQIGDSVFVLTKFIRMLRPLKKLSEKYVGPFKVIGRLGTHLYLVRLPNHLHSIYPVFYVSQLEPAIPNTLPNRTNPPPPPPIAIDGNLEYEIAQILDARLDRRRKNPLLYYVRWAGYEDMPKEFSRLTASELRNAQELVVEFHTQNRAQSPVTPPMLSKLPSPQAQGCTHDQLAFEL